MCTFGTCRGQANKNKPLFITCLMASIALNKINDFVHILFFDPAGKNTPLLMLEQTLILPINAISLLHFGFTFALVQLLAWQYEIKIENTN